MATVKSLERTDQTADPPVLLKANKRGKKKAIFFSFEVGAASPKITVNSGDVVELCVIPKGARIVGGHIAWQAMGAGATAIIGISGSTSKYLGSTSVAADGSAAFANTVALNCGEETTAEELLILTAGGANYAADKKVRGYIEYISHGE